MQWNVKSPQETRDGSRSEGSLRTSEGYEDEDPIRITGAETSAWDELKWW
jgi:hypothetical protein